MLMGRELCIRVAKLPSSIHGPRGSLASYFSWLQTSSVHVMICFLFSNFVQGDALVTMAEGAMAASSQRVAGLMAADIIKLLDLYYRKMSVKEVQYKFEFYRGCQESQGLSNRRKNHDQFHAAFPKHNSGNWASFAAMMLVAKDPAVNAGMSNWSKGGKSFEEFIGWLLTPSLEALHDGPDGNYPLAHKLVDLVENIERICRYSRFKDVIAPCDDLPQDYGIYLYEKLAEQLVQESVEVVEVPAAMGLWEQLLQ